MATFTQLSSGNWRCQVRRRGRYAAETFRRKKDADSKCSVILEPAIKPAFLGIERYLIL